MNLIKSRLLTKIVWLFMMMVIGTIITTGIITHQMMANRFKQYIRASYQIRIQQISSLLIDFYEANAGWKGRAFFLRNRQFSVLLIKVVDNEERIIFQKPIRPSGAHPIELVSQPLLSKGVKIGTAYYGIPQADLLYTPQDRFFRRAITESVLIASLIIASLAVYLAFWLAKGLTAPIRAMNQTALDMTEGNLTVRVENLPMDEIGELGRSLNLLAEKLQILEGLRQKMTADVAHDLRTPLSIIRSHLEAIQDGLIKPDSENIKAIMDETLRLIGLVDNLQQIALTDRAIHNIRKVQLNLNELLFQVYQTMLPLFNKKKIQFSYKNLAKHVLIDSDPHAIRQVITNLLDNAYKYTPSNKGVYLILDETERYLIISVIDEGKGIPASDLPFIFERFYRVDPARNREHGGFGLGLTIVRDLIHTLGGKIEVESEVGIRTRFIIYFNK